MIRELERYREKRVLVTGHTGFKGSWLCLWLQKIGAEVVGYALDPYTDRDNFTVSGLPGKMTDIRGDIRDFEKLRKTIDDHSPEIVFHMAAQTIVRDSYDYPKENHDINIGGTVNLLEGCRLSDAVKAIVIVTSDKCYKNKEWPWGYRENDELGGHDPYSSSKACAELVAESYRASFFPPQEFDRHGKALSSVRAGNVIGGGDWRSHRILPDCFRYLEKGEPIPVRNPEATRPWQFVLEPVGGYMLLGAKMLADGRNHSGAWNFGPDPASHITVQELVEIVLRKYGTGSWSHEPSPSQKKEMTYLSLDISKARQSLGWNPTLSVEQAVGWTVEWYRNYGKQDMSTFCDRQISEYIESWDSHESR